MPERSQQPGTVCPIVDVIGQHVEELVKPEPEPRTNEDEPEQNRRGEQLRHALADERPESALLCLATAGCKVKDPPPITEAWSDLYERDGIGELRIRAMRAAAERDLGARFDLRAFHDVVLGAGAIPLDVLAQRVDAWVAATKAAPAAVGATKTPGG